MDQVRGVLRSYRYAYRSEQTYGHPLDRHPLDTAITSLLPPFPGDAVSPMPIRQPNGCVKECSALPSIALPLVPDHLVKSLVF
jgi:hypothetical protein